MTLALTPAPAPSLLADDVVPRLGRRRAFINHKGGVGKTTITVNMAAALARAGKRVLVVDMDPQANATRGLGARLEPGRMTIGDVLATRVKGAAADAVVPCGWDTAEAPMIDVVPADLTLVTRDGEAAQPGSFTRLARVLFGVTDAYDFTLFDCRPTLGHLEQMVVRALDGEGDGYYLVVEPGHNAISGAIRATAELSLWAGDMEVGAPPLGVIVNLYDGRTNLHRGRAGAIAQSMDTAEVGGPPVLLPYIHRAVRIAELQDLAQSPTGDKRMEHEGHLERFDQLAETVAW